MRFFDRQMNRRIVNLTIPNIVTNITVPLLGMVDLAIVGSLGDTASIGAIAIGAQIFNLIYWNFGFLRMGTTGMTAQAYGRRNLRDTMNMLSRSLFIALCIAAVILILQRPLFSFANWFMNGSGELTELAAKYFFIRVWAAPATLGMYVFKGWFIGMQNTKTPMAIAVILNIINIIFSYLFALTFNMGIAGVALGTVIAQYSGCLMSMIVILWKYKRVLRYFSLKAAVHLKNMGRFFSVNSSIFLRSLFLSLVFASFTSFSTKMGTDILAVNTVLMQLFTLYSYIMDGFAYAAEALTGKYYGARDVQRLDLAVRNILVWGLILAVFFTVVYTFFMIPLISVFTKNPTVLALAPEYKWWVVAIPFTGTLAFLFDGVLVGMTKVKLMCVSIIIAAVFFYAAYWIFIPYLGNDAIWLAFSLFLVFRGVIQGAGYFRINRNLLSEMSVR